MPSLNKVELLGQLTKEPETAVRAGGEAVCIFTMAVTVQVENLRGEQVNETCFVDVEASGAVGEVVKSFFHKDSFLFLDGRLKYESVPDRTTGRRISRLYVVADAIQSPVPDGSPVPEPPPQGDGSGYPPIADAGYGEGMAF